MKKQNNAKAMREQMQQKRKQVIRETEAARVRKQEEAEAARKMEEARIKREQILKQVREKNPKLSDAKSKSSAKAAGLKSTFTLGEDSLLMTSFGKGNDAVAEKRIEGDTITSENAEPMFSAERNADKSGFDIRGRARMNATADDPRNSGHSAGDDLIHNRRALEQKFFGENFEDNIHIQLIYNILDIDKILTEYINNIIYTINNLYRRPGVNNDDIVGYMYDFRTSYEKFKQIVESDADPSKDGKKGKETANLVHELIRSPRMGYFGKIIFDRNLVKSNDAEKLNHMEERTYYLMVLLGMVRQSLAHNNADLYTLDGSSNKSGQEEQNREAARKALDEIFSEKIEALNKDFLKNSQKNLVILFDLLACNTTAEKTRIARDYYDFAMRKTYKNMGFSLKSVREAMLDYTEDAKALRDESYDSVRSKLYGLFDFILYEKYIGKEQKAGEELVVKLRAADSELDKQLLYIDEAKRLWGIVGRDIMDGLVPKMSGTYIKSLHGETGLTSDDLNGIMLNTDATYFSKLIYLLTNFLDGKEINNLLTTLVSKFENIGSFLSVLRHCGLNTEFKKAYKLFEKSDEIAGEMRVINSFARMTGKETDVKRAMYRDAVKVLGFEGGDEELEYVLDAISNTKSEAHKDNNLRNFITNNVLESRRFRYLMRYANTENIRALAQNGKVIAFVLSEIPDTQIERYHKAVSGGVYDRETGPDEMRANLCARVTGLRFDDFVNVKQKSSNPAENVEKERMKAVVGLYLTVLYLLTKNLVYANSRYFLAFHCAERDAALFDKELTGKLKENWSAYASAFLDKYPVKKHPQTYLATNLQNSDPWAMAAFRNKTEHLDAVMNAGEYLKDVGAFKSYFELYHYVMQRRLRDQFDYDKEQYEKGVYRRPVTLSGKTAEYFAFVEKYHNYSKDFVKALCVPFAYNLPRFKNLTVEGLFDKNRPGEDDTKAKEEA